MLMRADINEDTHPSAGPVAFGIQWKDHVSGVTFWITFCPQNILAVADALQWILSTKGITHSLHYLDDCILVIDSVEKSYQQKDILTSTFDSLGVPLEYSKLEGPHSCLTFWGSRLTLNHHNLDFKGEAAQS